MPFLTPEELKTNIYAYQLEQLTEGDEDIILAAIEAAVEECRSCLTANNKIEYRDGRWVYDTAQIFSAEDAERSPLVLALTKDLAMYHLVKICNIDFIHHKVQDAYDRAVNYLNRVAKGEVSPNLPKLELETQQPFRSGSRNKFNHE